MLSLRRLAKHSEKQATTMMFLFTCSMLIENLEVLKHLFIIYLVFTPNL